MKILKLLNILAAVSISCGIFYLVFMLFYNPVHFFYPPVDESLITPWLRSHLSPGEGIEAYFMVFGMVFYLGLVLFILKLLSGLRLSRVVLFFCLLPLIGILLRTRSEIFTFSPDPVLNLKIIASISVFLICCFWIFNLKSKTKSIFFYFLWLIFGLVIFLSMDPAAEFSYSFIIGPALKLIRGDSLTSFQIYYGLPLTLLFVALVKLKLVLNQMQLVFGGIFILWFVLYYFLASRLIKDKFLLLLFMLSLVMFRFFAIRHDPSAIVEVSPLRLELWVPLMLICIRYGILSKVTAAGFAGAYFLDNFFGAIYLAVYAGVSGFYFWREKLKSYFQLKLIALIIGAAALLRWFLFGSLFSETAGIYQSLRLYFQPISNRSVFWAILPVLGLFLTVVTQEKDRFKRNIFLLLLGISVVQLLYFFGPSLDHNLLNISGIYLLLLFICLDFLRGNFLSKRLIYILAAVFIVFGAVAFSRFFSHKLDQVYAHLVSGKITVTHPLDVKINNSPDWFETSKGKKILLMSDLDGYYNYRYGLPQIGYFTPYHTNIFSENTVKFLTESKKDGYRLILWESQMLNSLGDFNQSKYLQNRNLSFKAMDNGEYLEVSPENAATSSANPVELENWKSFNSKIFSFSYPPTWRVEEIENGILITDRLNQFQMFMEPQGKEIKILVSDPNSDKMVQFQGIVESIKHED